MVNCNMLEDDFLPYIIYNLAIKSTIWKMKIIHCGRIYLYKSEYFPQQYTLSSQLEHILTKGYDCVKRISRRRNDIDIMIYRRFWVW